MSMLRSSVKDKTYYVKLNSNLFNANFDKLQEEFKDEFNKINPAIKNFALDIKESEPMDALGLNLLVSLYKECEKHKLTFFISDISDQNRRYLSLFNLSYLTSQPLVIG